MYASISWGSRGTSSKDLPTKSPTSVLIKILLDVPTQQRGNRQSDFIYIGLYIYIYIYIYLYIYIYIYTFARTYDRFLMNLTLISPPPPKKKKKCMHIHLGILHWDTNETLAYTYTSSVSVGDLFCHLLEVSSLSLHGPNVSSTCWGRSDGFSSSHLCCNKTWTRWPSDTGIQST